MTRPNGLAFLITASICAAASTATAEPFAFDFEMPAVTVFNLSGETSTLRLILDNGSATPFSQTYGFEHIVSAQVLRIGGVAVDAPVLSERSSDGDQTQASIVTDADGHAVLDSGLPLNAWVSFDTAGSQDSVQLAARGTGEDGASSYALRVGDRFGQLNAASVLYKAEGRLAD